MVASGVNGLLLLTLNESSSGVKMEFGTYAGRAVLTAVDLVNSYDVVHDVERLAGAKGLTSLLTDRGWVIDEPISERQLARFRTLRGRLRQAFETPEVPEVVAGLNQV